MKCIHCNKETENPKFCSRSCSASYWNKKSPKKKTGLIKLCKICNNKISRTNRSYCSHDCYSKSRWNKTVEGIKTTGVIHPKGSYQSSQVAKKYISELNGPNCSVCGLEPMWNGKVLKMILDHVNGIPDDWRPENLRLVCHNCDSQLDTYKAKNKNGGRPSRRKIP